MLLSGFFSYLGIVFDDRFSWNEQIKQLISKAGKRLGMLGRLRRSLNRESANIVYCRPNMALKHSKTGLLLQNRNVRSNPAMDVLKWPTL